MPSLPIIRAKQHLATPFLALGAMRQGAGFKQAWSPEPLRPAARLLFLSSGSNPTFDYYFRSRLEIGPPLAHAILDVASPPPGDLDWRDAHVIICRYLPARWRAALESASDVISGLSLFLDDDMPHLVGDASLPLSYRYRVARDGLLAWPLLARMGAGMIVSTPELAARFSHARPVVLPPVPASIDIHGDSRAPEDSCAPEPPMRVIFHATDSHRHDHAFTAGIARLLAKRAPAIRFDVISSPRTRALWQGLPNVDLSAPSGWDNYRRLAHGQRGGVLIAPLIDTPLNRARSATKAIDAVRFGAAGLFGDLAPYHPLREVASLLPPDETIWADAIATLANDPDAWAGQRDRLKTHVAAWRDRPVWPEDWNIARMVAP